MDRNEKKLNKLELEKAITEESALFRKYYLWLEAHMPPKFFKEIPHDHLTLICHNLMGFPMQNFFSQLFLDNCAFVLCLDSPDADLQILKHYNFYGIRNYQTYLSDAPPPFKGIKTKLRLAAIYFSELNGKTLPAEEALPHVDKERLFKQLQAINPSLTHSEFLEFVCQMNPRFLRSLNEEKLLQAMDVFLRAKTRDHCQYEVSYPPQEADTPSMQIVFAWKNTPKHQFLYHLAKTIYRHNLSMTRVNATYVDPYSKDSILLMSLGLNGKNGEDARKATDIADFLQELVTLKYFDHSDLIESVFVDTSLLRGNLGNLLRSIISFVHQILVHKDPNLYTVANIEEAYCRHPELTVHLCRLFELKFCPAQKDLSLYDKERTSFLTLVDAIDTGNPSNDQRRINVLKQGLNFIDHVLKTNFYRANKCAHSFRLNPEYLNQVPFNRSEKFPEIPFAIFFIKGMHFIGFHIRFKDLARGGLRTVMPQRTEQMVAERNNVFIECYNLAYTQQKKNKDIPEGGAKAIIFLEPYDRLSSESAIYQRELQGRNLKDEEIALILENFKKEQKLEYLYQTQRAFVHSLLTLINCEDNGVLKAKDIIDYYKKPEYIYLGPDENMHNVMLEWIAEYSKLCGYKPGIAFISSKPGAGINHKAYGVTSYGVNVCMIEALKYLGIDPTTTPFTIKISGGPDGDVAGNQILNLSRLFPNTAKLVALTDISGTIHDPEGLDLPAMVHLFEKGLPIREYPVKLLHNGGFLLDTQTKKEQTAYMQQTLLYRKVENNLIEEWISGNEMNHLMRSNLNQTYADVFIPAGGRPRTLNDQNIQNYLDPLGKPTSLAIIEGANLYLTPEARHFLEDRGVIIIKDSSANKGGVIASSLEVLAGLTLSVEEFLEHKNELMKEFLGIIRQRAEDESKLILQTHHETGDHTTAISDQISLRINTYMYQILDYLTNVSLSNNPDDPLIRCLYNFCPPLLTRLYKERILKLPDMHKKAMIACHIASKIVYSKGLGWSPTIVDILPIIVNDPSVLIPPQN
ncbi:MAG: NAD-glutamate dehydrogenase [Simkaniaceae bacterium]|nr:NAD-glutamate dehydrogenase [Simkaniaceae bacterium]